MKRWISVVSFVFSAAVVVVATGCQAQMQTWQKDRIATRLAKIKAYHGVLVENGVLDGGTIESEIWFEAPASYRVRVRAPDSLAGSMMTFDGSTLQLYDPRTRLAVIYRNLPAVSSEERRALVDTSYDENLRAFTFEIGGKSQVAGLPVVELRFKAKGDSVIASGVNQVYDEYSFPLAGSMTFLSGKKYSHEFKSAHFNESASKAPALEIPKDAIVSEWDLNSKSYSAAEAAREAKSAGFEFGLPKSVPSGLEQVKIIRQKGPIAAFSTIYRNAAKSLAVMAFKDYGVKPAPARGVKMTIGKIEGRLLPNPHMNSYSFTKGSTSYVLTSNVSIDELIAIANQF